jgi:Spy/CpxP family protein refolding chaperone
MSIQNIRRSVVVAAAIAVLAISGVFAGRLVAHQLGGHSAGGTAPRLFRHMSRQLELTDGQQAQIREILKNHADEIEAHVKAAMEARAALHEAILVQPTNEAAIRQKAVTLGDLHEDGAMLFAKIRAEVWPLLTAEQQQKVATLHTQMRERGDESLKNLDEFLRGAN